MDESTAKCAYISLFEVLCALGISAVRFCSEVMDYLDC